MYSLSYKTRSGSAPGGKNRVYFLSHHEDFARSFEKISSDILALQNCVIYYDADMLADRSEADMALDLKSMQLFVVAVSQKLLTEPCRAAKEIEFARKNNILILPITVESISLEKYADMFGETQFLDSRSADKTEISYEKKLESFLDSVLVSDELAKRIRAAFDAYIFLSYRKKDRKFAQELMRLIHKNDFCRDIAIWYDEFLVPGENWNSAIESALEKSNLFTLVVTPNIINEDNYILSTEYPMARKIGKSILPVEMSKTSRAGLKHSLESLPEPVDPEEDGKLSESLKKALSEIALLENDSDPEHLFFIGLAYLGGIDVEIDQERAVRLIKTAAEAEVPEAMQKLAYMYYNGEAVERDFTVYTDWQRKCIDHYSARFKRTGLSEDFELMIDAYFKLGYACREMNNNGYSATNYESVIEQCLDHPEFETRDALSRAYSGFMIAFSKMRSPKSFEDLIEISRAAVSYSEKYAEEEGTPISKIRLAVTALSSFIINEVCKISELERVIGLLEDSLADIDSLEGNLNLGMAYTMLGAQTYDSDKVRAREFYKRSIEVYEKSNEEFESHETRQMLAYSYMLYASYYLEREDGRPEEAEALRDRAFELFAESYSVGNPGRDALIEFQKQCLIKLVGAAMSKDGEKFNRLFARYSRTTKNLYSVNKKEMAAARLKNLIDFLISIEQCLAYYGFGHEFYAEETEWLLTEIDGEADELFEIWQSRNFKSVSREAECDLFIDMDVRNDDFIMINNSIKGAIGVLTDPNVFKSENREPYIFISTFIFASGITNALVGNNEKAVEKLGQSLSILEKLPREKFEKRAEKLRSRIFKAMNMLK